MTSLTAAVRTRLRAAADPSLAPGQQAYMKSTMPFLGVRVREVRRLVEAETRTRRLDDPQAIAGAAATLWDEASYREERYAALALLGLRPVRGAWSLVDLHEHMARTGAWWDYVDWVARRIGELHDAHADVTAAKVRGWARDDSVWIRRLGILSQLGRRDRVDLDLLAEVIEPNLAHPELFVRKAVGWALREASYVRPDWVRAYVDGHELSPLSRREALKRLP